MKSQGTQFASTYSNQEWVGKTKHLACQRIADEFLFWGQKRINSTPSLAFYGAGLLNALVLVAQDEEDVEYWLDRLELPEEDREEIREFAKNGYGSEGKE